MEKHEFKILYEKSFILKTGKLLYFKDKQMSSFLDSFYMN
jgi:hypothetical protein